MEAYEFHKTMIYFDNISLMVNRKYKELFVFFSAFIDVYNDEERKLPYHINLIDELHADENAHSRILMKLFQQKSPKSKKMEIFENFIEFIKEKYNEKIEFQKINILNPIITCEKERIDIWIRDSEYVIIVENKIAWASDQDKQLERYIESSKSKNYKEEQIYVLYLPPIYDKTPGQESWGKYFNNNIHSERYLNLSYKDDILPWLNNIILTTVEFDENYLYSAIIQYIDHIEGKFNLRTTNNKMYMELQRFIRKELGLDGQNPEKDLEVLQEKTEEVDKIYTQMKLLLEQMRDDIDIQFIAECHKELEAKYPNAKIKNRIRDYKLSLGIVVQNQLIIWIGREESDKSFFCMLSNEDNSILLEEHVDLFKDDRFKSDFEDITRHSIYIQPMAKDLAFEKMKLVYEKMK